MGGASPMTKLFSITISLCYAGKRFTHRGIWTYSYKLKRNIRIIPFNKFHEWTGGKER